MNPNQLWEKYYQLEYQLAQLKEQNAILKEEVIMLKREHQLEVDRQGRVAK